MSGPRIAYLADSESQLRPAWLMARAIQDVVGGAVVGNLVSGKSEVSPRQVNAADVTGALLRLPLSEFLQRCAGEYDVVVAMLAGSKLYGLRRSLEARVQLTGEATRPILVTGYNGVVYEKHVEGLMWRIGYDAICVNSRVDQRLFEDTLTHLGLSTESLVRTGSPLVQARLEKGCAVLPPPDAPVRTVLFATQAIVPAGLGDRTYLIARLREYALVHPDRTVLIKPRTCLNETTFHNEAARYEAVYRRAFGRELPPNLHFAYGAFGQYLGSCDLIVAVSSTAVMEALAAGVRAAVLTDVGVAETLGNHFFLGSGLMCSISDLIADHLPALNSDWAAENGIDVDVRLASLGERVGRLLEHRAKAAGLLSWQPCHYDSGTAGAIDSAWLTSDLNPGRHLSRSDAFAKVSRVSRKLRKLYENPADFFLDVAKKRSRQESGF